MQNHRMTEVVKRCLFVWLLPLFFVLHGYVQFFGVLFLNRALWMLGVYWLSATLLLLLFRRAFDAWEKAALFVFVLTGYNFFFGAAFDAFKNATGSFFLTRYAFVLPLSVLLFALLFVQLKRTRKNPVRLYRFLNLLLWVLIAVEAVRLGAVIQEKKKRVDAPLVQSVRFSDTASRPDIFLILADGYAGKTAMNEALNFDNSAFESSLAARGFRLIEHTRSNYNSTPYSQASLLNMDYLKGIADNHENSNDVSLCYRLINDNAVTGIFKKNGYRFVNLSIFNIDNSETHSDGYTLFPTKERLLTDQTFVARIQEDVGRQLLAGFGIDAPLKNRILTVQRDNLAAERGLLTELNTKGSQPRFVYAHFMMPHHPYYCDRNGKPNDLWRIANVSNCTDNDYLEYVQYANQRFLVNIDRIMAQTRRNAVVILLSDHGYREFKKPVDLRYQFSNVCAVYVPNGKYECFPEGLTNVNFFRALFNSQFNLALPLLKDSVVAVR